MVDREPLGTATDVRDVGTQSTTAPTNRYRLSVVTGADAGQSLELTFQRDAPAIVGSSPVCSLRLSDRLVSRRHASLDVTESGLRLLDLESTNGTRVRGMRVRDVYLGHGDVVSMGDTSIRVDALADGDAPAKNLTVHRFGRVVGASPVMQRVYVAAQRFSAVDLPVVIEGETGTGKEMLAEALHEKSSRANQPFVVFDCTSVPPALLESALFGHEKGAFTGADATRVGVFEEADGGTLLLDEIGELDITLQPKLLRAIERSAIQRVGSNGWKTVNVRVLAATRRDLDREVAAGRFRDDLLFRLAVGRIVLPPLRDRKGDIALLTHHFWQVLGGGDRPIGADFLARLEDYPWPGNVRELHNTVARYMAVGEIDEQRHEATALYDSMERILAMDLPFSRARQTAADEFERRYVTRVLAKYGGNVVRAANASGIARRYFQILRARSNNKSPTG